MVSTAPRQKKTKLLSVETLTYCIGQPIRDGDFEANVVSISVKVSWVNFES